MGRKLVAGWRVRGGAALALVLSMQGVATAQTAPVTPPPNLPPNALPSREQVQPPTPGPRGTAPSTVRIDSSQAVRVAPCPLDGSDLHVALSKISFVTPSGKPLPAQIATLLGDIRPPAGEQSVSQVCSIRDRANAALRSAGYIASVQIPPQSITAGELVLQVVTARIVEIHVHGDAGSHAQVLLARIEKLKKLDPLNQHDAERILLLASDIPGVDVQLSLRPAGTQPGDLIGNLTIVDRRFAILANVQDYGSQQLGRWTAYARAETYGVLTPDDIVYAGVSSTIQTREQKIAQAGYTTGIGNDGITLGGRFTYAWSRPDLGLLDIRSRSLIGGIDLLAPVIRSVNSNLYLGTGAEIIEQRTRVYGDGDSIGLNRDKLRVLYARASGNLRTLYPDGEEFFSLSGAFEVRKGLGILDATKRGVQSSDGYTPSRFEGDPEALVLRANLDATMSRRPFSFYTGVRGQWANHPLLNFEEFSVGNLSMGRGYDPGSNSADRAVGLTNELRFDLGLFRKLPIQLFAFNDMVWIWNLDQGTTETDRHLRSYGGGARVTLPSHLVLELTYAHPRDRALAFDKSPPPDRFLMSLTVQLSQAGQH